MSIILKTTNLCKSFNGQTAVNNISLNIERNSVYGLLGPNGAGKSTTLKMITGILRPTSGSIEFDGHAWKRSDLNHIGALIEMPPLYENLTAYENLKVRTTIWDCPIYCYRIRKYNSMVVCTVLLGSKTGRATYGN